MLLAAVAALVAVATSVFKKSRMSAPDPKATYTNGSYREAMIDSGDWPVN